MSATKATAVVSGVTGNQGRAVAEALVAAGFRVIGLSRTPRSEKSAAVAASGVEVVQADLNDPASLAAALQAAGPSLRGVFCVTNYWAGNTAEKEIDQMRHLLGASRAHGGVGLFVYSSCGAADPAQRRPFDAPGQLPDFDTRWACERILSGDQDDTAANDDEEESAAVVPWVVLRPVQFAENFFGALPETHVATDAAFGWPGFDANPNDDVKHAFVALSDFGKLVAAAMNAPDAFAGKTLDVASFALSARDLLATYERVRGLPAGSVKPKGAIPLWLLWFVLPAGYRLFRFFNTADFPVDLDHCATYMPVQTPWADVLRGGATTGSSQ